MIAAIGFALTVLAQAPNVDDLSAPVTYEADMRSLYEAVAALASQSDAKLAVHAELAERKVSMRLRKRPVGPALHKVALLFGGSWTFKEGVWTLRLTDANRTKQAAQSRQFELERGAQRAAMRRELVRLSGKPLSKALEDAAALQTRVDALERDRPAGWQSERRRLLGDSGWTLRLRESPALWLIGFGMPNGAVTDGWSQVTRYARSAAGSLDNVVLAGYETATGERADELIVAASVLGHTVRARAFAFVGSTPLEELSCSASLNDLGACPTSNDLLAVEPKLGASQSGPWSGLKAPALPEKTRTSDAIARLARAGNLDWIIEADRTTLPVSIPEATLASALSTLTVASRGAAQVENGLLLWRSGATLEERRADLPERFWRLVESTPGTPPTLEALALATSGLAPGALAGISDPTVDVGTTLDRSALFAAPQTWRRSLRNEALRA